MTELRDRIQRLDQLISQREDGNRGLGLRLALGLALELRQGMAPGTETSALVSDWLRTYGPETVDDAVAQARALVKDPAGMARELSRRMDEAKGGADRA
ncbi:MAG TPA: hypothetical protein PKO15_03100 [Fibrobacteria bacterium]|nr:hypothetical protein [Fibrobacteria bacterium]HOX50532.1 hypothetical protein [Fibrobacteria bacterium]